MTLNKTNRVLVLIDGMNLFNNAKRAFKSTNSPYNYDFPNYDITKLANVVCITLGCQLSEIRFYTGVPRQSMDENKHYFWVAKTQAMQQSGVIVYTRALRNSNPPQEKGVDLRIGLDALSLAYGELYDTLVIFSTDQDFTEVRDHVTRVAKSQGRTIRFVSAYPLAPGSRIWGINGLRACTDPTANLRTGVCLVSFNVSARVITARAATAIEPNHSHKKKMARLTGFEPTTSAFAGLRSIR